MTTDFDTVIRLLRSRPEAQAFIRRRYGIPNAALDTLARYIVVYGKPGERCWASLGAPHVTSMDSHGAGCSERDAVENLLDNLHRIRD